MGCLICSVCLWLGVPVVLAALIWFYLNSYKFFKSSISDTARQDGYFGFGDPKLDDTTIRKFEFPAVTDEDINDLKQRLAKTRFSEPLEDVKNFEYGFNINYLRTLVDYWQNQYDWRKNESRFKKFDHFVTQIEGLQVHFIHIKPKSNKSSGKPIIICSGWPSNFFEYIRVMESIQEENEKNPDGGLEVILPSIPGYGFSESPHKKGFNTLACGRIFGKLMQRLGHQHYYLHGSDWGSTILKSTAAIYPECALGFHTIHTFIEFNGNFFVRSLLAKLFPSWILSNPERDLKLLFPLSRNVFYIIRESGYFHIQATKPDTVGAALNDSPAGLAAYILEKYSTWTREKGKFEYDGELTRKYQLDDLLTIVSLYWFQQKINSSQRMYKESFGGGKMEKFRLYCVPCGITNLGDEVFSIPREFAEPLLGDIVYSNHLDHGGHFFALEEPSAFLKEMKKFIVACERLQKSS